MTATETTIELRWTTSRGRDTYGYNICTLYADGRKLARCNGGGYDMEGTCLGTWLAREYADRLLALTEADMEEQSHWEPARNKDGTIKYKGHAQQGRRVDDGRYFYGLSYIDPNYDASKAVVNHAPVFGKGEDAGKTVEQLEAEGKSLGLERYQAFWSATSKHPTERHTVPHIDGACGKSSVERIAKAIGIEFEWIPTRSKKLSIYRIHDKRAE